MVLVIIWVSFLCITPADHLLTSDQLRKCQYVGIVEMSIDILSFFVESFPFHLERIKSIELELSMTYETYQESYRFTLIPLANNWISLAPCVTRNSKVCIMLRNDSDGANYISNTHKSYTSSWPSSILEMLRTKKLQCSTTLEGVTCKESSSASQSDAWTNPFTQQRQYQQCELIYINKSSRMFWTWRRRNFNDKTVALT